MRQNILKKVFAVQLLNFAFCTWPGILGPCFSHCWLVILDWADIYVLPYKTMQIFNFASSAWPYLDLPSPTMF